MMQHPRIRFSKTRLVPLAGLALIGLLAAMLPLSMIDAADPAVPASPPSPQGDAKSEPAVEVPADALARARKQIAMLDDMYKTSIVLITTHYVHDDDDLPAGQAFKELFKTVQAKGWHEVRLIDGTGQPDNEDNIPQAGFEQRAMKQLLAGKPYYDEVVSVAGQPTLRAATAVPVVMEKCVMCHSHYADVPAGQAIGALSYSLKIE